MNINTIDQKYNDILSTLSKALCVSESDVKDAVLRSYIPDNDETDNRIRRVLCKAARGEKITVAGIGGSITEGAWAHSHGDIGNNAREYTEDLDGEKCWFKRTVDWFRTTFPQTEIHGINAGIGATPSFLGTFRLDQMVLSHKPDLVTVEFSVNDPSAVNSLLKDEILEAYESIVRRLLEAGIAVIQIFLVEQQGESLQKYHLEIADHYNVPAISYHNAVYPDGNAICEWSKLSPDNIHPNNAGHALLGTCVCNYLDNVLNSTDLSEQYPIDSIHTSWIYFDTFQKTYAQYAYQFYQKARGGFEFIESIPDVCHKWQGALVSDNCEGSIKLVVPKGAKRVYVQYFDSYGSFETDFINQKTVCNTMARGWPKANWHRVYTGSATTQDAEIIIKSHKKGKVILQGLLITF